MGNAKISSFPIKIEVERKLSLSFRCGRWKPPGRQRFRAPSGRPHRATAGRQLRAAVGQRLPSIVEPRIRTDERN